MDGAFPLEKSMYVTDQYRNIGESLSQYAVEKLGKKVPLWYGYAFMGGALDWYQKMWDHGGLGPVGETFVGGIGGRGQCDLEAAGDWHYEHECLISYTIEDEIMEFGSPSDIEEAVKKLCLRHKHQPKFIPGMKPTYWTPPQNLDAAIEAVKKYGSYE